MRSQICTSNELNKQIVSMETLIFVIKEFQRGLNYFIRPWIMRPHFPKIFPYFFSSVQFLSAIQFTELFQKFLKFSYVNINVKFEGGSILVFHMFQLCKEVLRNFRKGCLFRRSDLRALSLAYNT